ncbi:2-polyprenyl-6-methoxyphenol hydroxylase [Duganella sp. CF458]|uniref:styrene monooxygenase/indole monooxygenase family protein n=1 Tax=Duganella sp. CF458 TaxID=1884368 RepID=UPI0008F2BB50|nr:styrene monooxygenase/indole monooxygenase family protein [Duganella sp. CF458]SFG82675.1 2-polyprenyl-6-methoxyphenol hydroxylase [Duganella sp. CF458]
MRKIAIVGGGQAGLPLALGLLANGFEVTVASNRSPDDILNGRVMSSQCMFDAALQIERDLGLDHWGATCPTVDGIGLTVPHPDAPHERLIDWSARLDRPARAVDQRIKMPALMHEFERRGGTLLIADVGVADLERLAAENDLVLLAAGKGELTRMFERDAGRSAFDRPQRALALTYVNGLRRAAEYSRVAFNLIPGVGEYFVFPALTTGGPCDIMVFEGVPGGPMDCWRDIRTPQAHLEQSLDLLRTFLPWEAERATHVELTDANGILAGSFAPTVRKPVATLPSGKLVFGLGDAVVISDPITGQGSNNATKAARVYLDAILAHGDRPYTREWMEQTFERFWEYGEKVVTWTNSLLCPPPPHILDMLGAAGNCPPLASAIANGFNHPPDYFPWWVDADACERFVAQCMGLARRGSGLAVGAASAAGGAIINRMGMASSMPRSASAPTTRK